MRQVYCLLTRSTKFLSFHSANGAKLINKEVVQIATSMPTMRRGVRFWTYEMSVTDQYLKTLKNRYLISSFFSFKTNNLRNFREKTYLFKNFEKIWNKLSFFLHFFYTRFSDKRSSEFSRWGWFFKLFKSHRSSAIATRWSMEDVQTSTSTEIQMSQSKTPSFHWPVIVL